MPSPNHKIGRGRAIVVELPFQDARLDRRCHERVPCDRDVGAAFGARVVQELREAGFAVSQGPSTRRAPHLTGQLTQYFVEEVANFAGREFEADLGVRLSVTSAGLDAERRFYFKEHGLGAGFGGFRFEEVVAGVERQSVEALVLAVAELLDRSPVPEGGSAP